MKLTTLLLLITFASFGQRKVTMPSSPYWFLAGPQNSFTFQDKGRLNITVEVGDTATYIYTVTRVRKYADAPKPDVVTNIDNIDTRNAYSVGWEHVTDATWTQPFFNKTGSYPTVSTATLETTFDGYKVEWYAEKRVNHGIVGVSIDGGTESMIDLYDPTAGNNSQKVFESTLASGTHKIKIRITGTKATSATDWNIVHDRFIVYKKG